MAQRSPQQIPQYERGEANPQAKLTTDDVLQCLKLHESGYCYRSIARMFRVSTSCVGAVCRGRTWNWLTRIATPPGPRRGRRRIHSVPGQLTLF